MKFTLLSRYLRILEFNLVYNLSPGLRLGGEAASGKLDKKSTNQEMSGNQKTGHMPWVRDKKNLK